MHNRRHTAFVVAFLSTEAAAGIIWWALLLARPALRVPFMAPNAPDSTLLAFLLPDAILFIGAGAAAAWAVARDKPWAGLALALHAGAAFYAGLYGVGLVIWSGGGWLGALLMLPSMLVAPYLAWRLAPR